MGKLLLIVFLAVLASSCVSVSAAPDGNSITIAVATPDAALLPDLGSLPGLAPAPGVDTSKPAPQPAGDRKSYASHLPNPQMTPGDALDVTTHDICQTGYTKKVRDVPESVKNQVYQAYGVTSHEPGDYEVDHLIALELGGSNSVKNLWPEPYAGDWNARIKDRLENELHDRVCAGQMDLKAAQREIATDWIAAYQKYVGQGK